MFSLGKALLTLGSLLGASQLFTIRSSVYFAFLVGFQRRQSNASTSTIAIRRQYDAFLIAKALFYLAIGAYIQSGVTSVYLKLRGHYFLGELTVDPLLSIITAKYPAASVFFLTGLILFSIYIFYVDYGLSLGLDTSLTSLIYQITCENPKALFTLNVHLQKVPPIRSLLLHPVNGFTKIRLAYSQLWNPTQKLTFAQSRLEGFPNLSTQTRSRLVFLTLFYEYAFACVALFLVLFVVFLVIITMNILSSDVSLSFAIAVFIDTLILAFIGWHTLIFVLVFYQFLVLFTFLTRSHIKEMETNLAILLSQLKTRRISNGNRHLIRELNNFFTQHNSLATIQAAFNEKMMSRFAWISLHSNLLLQIVLINIYLLESLQWEEKCVCLMLSFSQTGFAFQITRLLITWSNSLYSSGSLLFQAQKMLLRPENRFRYPTTVTAKLKLMTNIERLSTKKKEQFTVGPLGDISNRSIYEFFYAYSGFFFYVTSLMKKLH